METARIVGIETEYGITSTQMDVYSIATRVVDASAQFVGAVRRGVADWMLANGARAYVDHAHPEYSTPECPSPLAVIAADRAGEAILESARQQVEATLPVGARVRLYKNNRDGHGHSYGCHENYLLDARTFEEFFARPDQVLTKQWIPFLVTRQIFTGAGKVGADNDTVPAGFQISQRADFFETRIGIETMASRPIVNTRDEPHCDPARWRRLHVIIGDANLSEYSALLKIGVTQIILTMLQARIELPDLTLGDPIDALQRVSRDLTFRKRLRLTDRRALTALEIQHVFLSAARQYVRAHPVSPEDRLVIREWANVLRALREQPARLARRLDWAIKLAFLNEQRRALKTRGWDDTRLRESDIKYHDTRPEGIFHLLQNAGLVDRLIASEAITSAITTPPATRAATRAAMLARAPQSIQQVDWATLRMGNARFELPDPRVGSADHAARLLATIGDARVANSMGGN